VGIETELVTLYVPHLPWTTDQLHTSLSQIPCPDGYYKQPSTTSLQPVFKFVSYKVLQRRHAEKWKQITQI